MSLILPKPGSIYQHYKGSYYRVLANAKLEASSSRVVVYESLKDQQVWVRPLMEWLQITDTGVPRFREQTFLTASLNDPNP